MKWMKKMATIAMSTVMGITLLSSGVQVNQVAEAATPFKDVKDTDWFSGAVEVGSERGMIAGYEDGTFRPNNKVTQAEFLTMFIRYYSPEEVVEKTEGQPWDESMYQYAKKMKWEISEEGRYQPISRGKVAIILTNAIGVNCSLNDSIQILLDGQVSNGKVNATIEGYKAEDTLTRAEAIQFLLNFTEKISEISEKPDHSDNCDEYKHTGNEKKEEPEQPVPLVTPKDNYNEVTAISKKIAEKYGYDLDESKESGVYSLIGKKNPDGSFDTYFRVKNDDGEFEKSPDVIIISQKADDDKIRQAIIELLKEHGFTTNVDLDKEFKRVVTEGINDGNEPWHKIESNGDIIQYTTQYGLKGLIRIQLYLMK